MDDQNVKRSKQPSVFLQNARKVLTLTQFSRLIRQCGDQNPYKPYYSDCCIYLNMSISIYKHFMCLPAKTKKYAVKAACRQKSKRNFKKLNRINISEVQ